jgi:hypothetical protein
VGAAGLDVGGVVPGGGVPHGCDGQHVAVIVAARMHFVTFVYSGYNC